MFLYIKIYVINVVNLLYNNKYIYISKFLTSSLVKFHSLKVTLCMFLIRSFVGGIFSITFSDWILLDMNVTNFVYDHLSDFSF